MVGARLPHSQAGALLMAGAGAHSPCTSHIHCTFAPAPLHPASSTPAALPHTLARASALPRPLPVCLQPEQIRQCLVDYASINVWQLQGADSEAPSIVLAAA